MQEQNTSVSNANARIRRGGKGGDSARIGAVSALELVPRGRQIPRCPGEGPILEACDAH